MASEPTKAAAGESRTLIEYRDLWKAFGDKEVLRGVDLLVNRGETQVIMGSSGSGKSVMLSMLVGLLTPDRGEVLFDGEDVARFTTIEDWRRVWLRTGFLFQGAALFDSMNVGENVGFPLRQHSQMSEPQIAARVAEVLSWIELEGIEKKMPSELSGGMRKRAAIARALALEPEVLFLDEPTSGLDPTTARGFDAMVRSLVDDLGITVFLVTHDLDTLLTVVDRIIVLADGKVLADGPARDVIQVDDPWIQNYFSVRTMVAGSDRRA